MQSVLGSNPDPAPSSCVSLRVTSLAAAFFSVLFGKWGFAHLSHTFVLSTAYIRPRLGAGDSVKELDAVFLVRGWRLSAGARQQRNGRTWSTQDAKKTHKAN